MTFSAIVIQDQILTTYTEDCVNCTYCFSSFTDKLIAMCIYVTCFCFHFMCCLFLIFCWLNIIWSITLAFSSSDRSHHISIRHWIDSSDKNHLPRLQVCMCVHWRPGESDTIYNYKIQIKYTCFKSFILGLTVACLITLCPLLLLAGYCKISTAKHAWIHIFFFQFFGKF